jgi:hypothetical protein
LGSPPKFRSRRYPHRKPKNPKLWRVPQTELTGSMTIPLGSDQLLSISRVPPKLRIFSSKNQCFDKVLFCTTNNSKWSQKYTLNELWRVKHIHICHCYYTLTARTLVYVFSGCIFPDFRLLCDIVAFLNIGAKNAEFEGKVRSGLRSKADQRDSDGSW